MSTKRGVQHLREVRQRPSPLNRKPDRYLVCKMRRCRSTEICIKYQITLTYPACRSIKIWNFKAFPPSLAHSHVSTTPAKPPPQPQPQPQPPPLLQLRKSSSRCRRYWKNDYNGFSNRNAMWSDTIMLEWNDCCRSARVLGYVGPGEKSWRWWKIFGRQGSRNAIENMVLFWQ